MIIDYSVSRPPMSALKAAGVTAVGRYIGWDSVAGYPSIGKNISVAESHELLDAGMSIFLAFEYAADASALGASQGTKDGQLAKAQLSELGSPPDMAVYFAVDFDIPDYAPSLSDTAANALSKLGPVGQYFKAINALKDPYEIGVYGGYFAVRRLFDAGLVTKGWQTVAWSGGQRDTRAVLYQLASASPIAGGDIDIRENSAITADFGQWPRPTTTPPTPPPPPVPVPVVQEEDMQLTKLAFVPFAKGTRKYVTLYRDFNGPKSTSVVRVAVHSELAGYGQVENVTLDTASPVTVTFKATDANAVSLSLESGNSPVGYTFN